MNFCYFKLRNVNATIHRSCARFRCLRVRTRNGHVLFIRRRVTSFLSICPYPTALRLSEHKQSNLLVVPRYLPDCESNLTLSVSSVKTELIRFIYPRINRVSIDALVLFVDRKMKNERRYLLLQRFHRPRRYKRYKNCHTIYAFSFVFCLIISDSLPLKKREKLI